MYTILVGVTIPQTQTAPEHLETVELRASKSEWNGTKMVKTIGKQQKNLFQPFEIKKMLRGKMIVAVLNVLENPKKYKKPVISFEITGFCGACGRTRTGDLRITKILYRC